MANAKSIGVESPRQIDAKNLLKIGDVARLMNAHPNSIRRWIEKGEMSCVFVGRQRRFPKNEIQEYLYGDEQGAKSIVLYSRVSTGRQKDSLKNQRERLAQYAAENFANSPTITISEIGSGGNLSRPGFKQLVTGIIEGRFSKVIALWRDRVSRECLQMLLLLGEMNDCEFIFVEHDAKSERATALDDLSAIIYLWSVKNYGSRHSRKKIMPAEAITRAATLIDQGLALQAVTRQLACEGFAYESGEPISLSSVHKQVYKVRQKLTVLPIEKDSTEIYFNEKVVKGRPTARLPIKAVYKNYLAYCRTRKLTPLPTNKLARRFASYPRGVVNGQWCVNGVEIRDESLHIEVKPYKKVTDETAPESLIRFYSINKGFSGSMLLLYKRYVAWCGREKLDPLKKNKVARILNQLGATRTRICTGTHYQF